MASPMELFVYTTRNNQDLVIHVSLDFLDNSPNTERRLRRAFEIRPEVNGERCQEYRDYEAHISNACGESFAKFSNPKIYNELPSLTHLTEASFYCKYKVRNDVFLHLDFCQYPGEHLKGGVEPGLLKELKAVNEGVFPLIDPAKVKIHPQSEDLEGWDYNIKTFRGLVTVSILGKDTKEYFFKGYRQMHEDDYNELRKYVKIQQAGISDTLRTPQLRGIVALADGDLVGYLYDTVKTGEDKTLETLVDHAKLNPSDERRAKWINQIEEAVEKFHELELVWGDVKPQNVLIDVNDDAVIIDLEGGRTAGWIDLEDKNTRGGDYSGLAKLREFVEDYGKEGEEASGIRNYPDVNAGRFW